MWSPEVSADRHQRTSRGSTPRGRAAAGAKEQAAPHCHVVSAFSGPVPGNRDNRAPSKGRGSALRTPKDRGRPSRGKPTPYGGMPVVSALIRCFRFLRQKRSAPQSPSGPLSEPSGQSGRLIPEDPLKALRGAPWPIWELFASLGPVPRHCVVSEAALLVRWAFLRAGDRPAGLWRKCRRRWRGRRGGRRGQSRARPTDIGRQDSAVPEAPGLCLAGNIRVGVRGGQ